MENAIPKEGGGRTQRGRWCLSVTRGTVDFWGYGDNVALLAHIWEMLVQWLENCFLQAGEGAGLGAAGRGAFLRSWGPHRGELLQRAETLLPGHR